MTGIICAVIGGVSLAEPGAAWPAFTSSAVNRPAAMPRSARPVIQRS
jgi:hypothetical protein